MTQRFCPSRLAPTATSFLRGARTKRRASGMYRQANRSEIQFVTRILFALLHFVLTAAQYLRRVARLCACGTSHPDDLSVSPCRKRIVSWSLWLSVRTG